MFGKEMEYLGVFNPENPTIARSLSLGVEPV